MTHTDRARAFLDHLGRELPLPAGEVEMLAGLLADVEREALAEAAGECRRRAEVVHKHLSANVAGVWYSPAAYALDAAASAIEELHADKPKAD